VKGLEMATSTEKHRAAVNRLVALLETSLKLKQAFTFHPGELQAGEFSITPHLRLAPPQNLPADIIMRTHTGQLLVLKIYGYGDAKRVHTSIFRCVGYACESIPTGQPYVQVLETTEKLHLREKFPFINKLMSEHNLDANGHGFTVITTLNNFLNGSWIDEMEKGRAINE